MPRAAFETAIPVTKLAQTYALDLEMAPGVVTCSKGKAVPLHAIEALGGRGSIAPTHSQPRH
jgi:hypothetical protein